ncbi:hypothetical protein [Xanthomonas graminis]|uniref:hypothetical protein n=1 Tax=Xanthomonas graminis TaxID=3390026 RepID=UPI0011876577|nr:hypothetical protein [Xanthomonas translucens]UKE77999.1 hypothetical protein KM317_01695 [Xanthomonas translucens pv. arrhenatheri]
MNRSTIFAALALFLVACSPSPQPNQQPVAETSAPAPAPAPAAAPAPEAEKCDHVADLFDMLVKKKADGWVEADVLADMSARGEYSLGYVVDGVFGDRFGPGGGAMARADTLAACRRMAKGGDLY